MTARSAAAGADQRLRRLRIATGSGTSTSEVNQLLKQFKDVAKMMKRFGGSPKGKAGRKAAKRAAANMPSLPSLPSLN